MLNLAELNSFVGYEIEEDFKGSDGRIKIYLRRNNDLPILCNCCGHEIPKVRSRYLSRVKHLPIFEHKTELIFRRLKGFCEHCKKYRSEQVPFLSKQSPHLSNQYAYWLSRLCEITTIKEAAEFCGVDDATLWRVDFKTLKARFSEYKIPDVRRISVDEVCARSHSKYEGEGRNEKYFTVVTDIESKKVIWVSDSRNKDALDDFFQRIGPKRCRKIVTVASDQHPGYRLSIKEFCPQARHVLDKFHLMRNFEDAVNDSRKFIFKIMDKDKKHASGRFRFIYLKKASQRTDKERKYIEQVMNDNKLLVYLELIKERMFDFFSPTNTPTEARDILKQMEQWIFELGAPPLKRWLKNFKRDWRLIVNYFYEKVTSSISEGFNNVIKTLKRKAYGYSNMEYFKLKIMQKIGYLNSRYANKSTLTGY